MIDKIKLDMHVETLENVKSFLDGINAMNSDLAIGPNGLTDLETLCKSADIETRDTDPALKDYSGIYERDACYKQQLSESLKIYSDYMIEVSGYLNSLGRHYGCLNENGTQWFHEKPEVETVYQEALADKDFNWIDGPPNVIRKNAA